MRDKVYRVWTGIKQRCNNPKTPRYHDYGGRGITIHPSFNSFEAFYAEVGNPPTFGHTLDRVDNDRGYEPGNLRWATRQEQSLNRRDNNYQEINGVTMLLVDWCEAYKIPKTIVLNRLNKNMPLLEALSAPHYRRPREKKPKRKGMRRFFTIGEETKTFGQWCDHYEISYYLFKKRLLQGMTPIEAYTADKPPKVFHKPRENRTGYTGVAWIASKGKFRAQTNKKWLGYFNTAKEAGEAYQKAKQGI
jgi:hypothetical protein